MFVTRMIGGIDGRLLFPRAAADGSYLIAVHHDGAFTSLQSIMYGIYLAYPLPR